MLMRRAWLALALFGISTTAAGAQEAVRNTAPLQLAGGSSDRLIWLSPAAAREGSKLSFWLFILPRSVQTIRYFSLVQRQDNYDANAQLFEADCSARKQVRRMRDEYYLGNVHHTGATASEQHAQTLAVSPNSPVSIALDMLCGNTPARSTARTLAEARRMSDAHFRRLATPARPPASPASPPAGPAPGSVDAIPAPGALPRPWECAGAARAMLGRAKAAYWLALEPGTDANDPSMVTMRRRIETEEANVARLHPDLNLTREQANAARSWRAPAEIRDRCLAALNAGSAPAAPLLARPALLWGQYEPGSTTPFYRLKPEHPGFYISHSKYDGAPGSRRRQVMVIQALPALANGADSIAHVYFVDCDARTLWRLEQRKLRDGDIVGKGPGDPRPAAPTGGGVTVVAATCGLGAMGTMVGSVSMMNRDGLIP